MIAEAILKQYDNLCGPINKFNKFSPGRETVTPTMNHEVVSLVEEEEEEVGEKIEKIMEKEEDLVVEGEIGEIEGRIMEKKEDSVVEEVEEVIGEIEVKIMERKEDHSHEGEGLVHRIVIKIISYIY